MSDVSMAPEISAVPETAWAEARRCFPVMQRLSNTPRRTRAHVIAAATELGYSSTQVYELLSRFLADPRLTSLLPRKRGSTRGGSRLSSGALAVILLGMIWTDTTLDERNQIWRRYEYESLDEPRLEMHLYDCRHDSLRFLAWLIDGWPNSSDANVGHDMLWRGLSGRRNRFSHHVLPRWNGHPWSPSPHDFAPEILGRLRKLLED